MHKVIFRAKSATYLPNPVLVYFVVQKCPIFDLKMVSKWANFCHRKMAKKNRCSTILGNFSKIRKKSGDTSPKMVTAVTGIFNGYKILIKPVFMRVSAFLWILLKTIHETEVSPMSPKWLENGDTDKPSIYKGLRVVVTNVTTFFILKLRNIYNIYVNYFL